MRSSFSQISIHKLEVFCLVAELGSFSLAAERLGIAQPVVSAHIKALSAKLGVPLLSRNGRRTLLTEEGQRVHRWARDMVGRTLELEREIADSRRGAVGKAVVGASMTVGSYMLPATISAFRQQTPKGQISVRVTAPLTVTDEVMSGDCDFAFSILGPRHETGGLIVERIMEEDLVLVASAATSPSGGTLMPGDLAVLPFISAQAGTPRRDLEDIALGQFGIRRSRIVLEFGHAEAIKQAVRAGAGLSFLFRASVRDELASGTLREIATPGMEMRVPVYQVTRRGKKLSQFQVAVMRYLAQGLREHAGMPAA